MPAKHPSRDAALGHYKAGEPMCDLCEARIPHGTQTGHRWGCRCQPCRQAKKAAGDAYDAANREAAKARKSAWGARNPEKVTGSKRAWRLANRERERSVNAAYRARRPEVSYLKAARARARQRGVPFDLTAEYLRELIDASDRCPICGVVYEQAESSGCTQASRTLDRDVPERGYVLGNVSFMCEADNVRKRSRTLAEYLAWLEGRGVA